MEGSISTSASTVRSLHMPCISTISQSLSSQQSSPRSSALPSPPDSPSSDSVSSLPSVSSSFFFSSGAANSPQQSDNEHDHHELNQGLIIPSLMLPPALRQPTDFGKTIGDVRLIVVTGSGAGPSFTTKLLLEDNEDIVDFDPWEQLEYGRMLRASTDWQAQHDPHGLEKYEPARNVEIVELPGYTQSDSVNVFAERVKDLIHAPFHSISDVIMPSAQPLTVAASLMSSPTTPLYTALIMVVPSAVTSFEESLMHQLSTHIPIILFSKPSSRQHHRHLQNLTAFRPTTTAALRSGLFRSPEVLGSLRSEAADRFLRWREIEHTAAQLQMIRRRRRKSSFALTEGTTTWSKSEWEAEWEARMSEDAERRMQENVAPSEEDDDDKPQGGAPGLPFDPLHFPSLLLFSVSLLAPLRDTIRQSVIELCKSLNSWNVRLAILGGFCIGVGAGIIYK